MYDYNLNFVTMIYSKNKVNKSIIALTLSIFLRDTSFFYPSDNGRISVQMSNLQKKYSQLASNYSLGMKTRFY